MREILFRAKTINNPRWVKGYFAEADLYLNGNIVRRPVIVDKDDDMKEIDPSTLSQFTGLYDKKGVKIFEGDIVKQYDDIGKVYWDEDACRFLMRVYNTGLPNNLVLPCWSALHSSCTYEVIGNIYDNPELLEEAQNDA